MQTNTELIAELRDIAKLMFRLGDLSKAATLSAAATKIERLDKELSDLKKVNEKLDFSIDHKTLMQALKKAGAVE